MKTTLPVRPAMPGRPRARYGDQIVCSTTSLPDGADWRTRLVCRVAFWGRGVTVRRYGGVVRDVRFYLDKGHLEEGLSPDPESYRVAREWVDHAIAAKNSPLTVVPR
jgi:hypothetical protein